MSSKYDKNDKYRDWIFILYPESMIPDWQDKLDEVLQVPCCYIIHDKDNYKLEENENERKIHVHLWVHWNNCVWYGAILKIINKNLAKDKFENGCVVSGVCCNTAEPVFSSSRAWEYLLHKDPKSLKKDYKHKYNENERICLNNFDIGSLLELTTKQTMYIKSQLSHFIIDNGIQDIATAFLFIESNFDDNEMYVFQNFNSYFDRVCAGVYKYNKREMEKPQYSTSAVESYPCQ